MAAERSAAAELQPEGQGGGELAGGFRQLLEEEEEEGAEDAGYVLYRYGRGGAGPERPGLDFPRRGREVVAERSLTSGDVIGGWGGAACCACAPGSGSLG